MTILQYRALSNRTVAALAVERDTVFWDREFTGFGVRVQPTGLRSYLVNYRADDRGRTAANRRIVIGRHGPITADQARRRAREILGKAALGEDPAGDRARSRAMPTLHQAFEDYLAAGPRRRDSTIASYRRAVHKDLGDWLDRSLDDIDRRDVEQRFRQITEHAGWVQANIAVKLLGAIYRRPCLDFDDLRNPVERWHAGGGRLHRPRRRRIQPPAEVLPRWHRGFETAVRNPVARDAFRFGLYTGMRLTEVIALAWTQVDMATMTVRIDDTKSGEPLEFPVTRQLVAILERRFAEREEFAGEARGWVFPSEASTSGHLESIQHLNARIGEAGGAKFWFHALRNCFITVADRELMLPTSLTKRLVNHAPSQDITEGYAADWTMEQLRIAAQRIADRIDELTLGTGPLHEAASQTAFRSFAGSTAFSHTGSDHRPIGPSGARLDPDRRGTDQRKHPWEPDRYSLPE